MATFKIHSFSQKTTFIINADATGITRINIARAGEPAYDAKPDDPVDINGTIFTVGCSWRSLPGFTDDVRIGLETLHTEFPAKKHVDIMAL